MTLLLTPRSRSSLRGGAPWSVVASAAIALSMLPCPASASPFDVFGAGARGQALGAQTATARDAGAIYYNVAALTHAAPGVSVGILATSTNAEILLMERPAGYDVPDFGAESPSLPSSQTLALRSDTALEPLYGLSFGGVTSLGIDGFRLGLLGFLPAAHLLEMQTHHADERERLFSNQLHFELLDAPTRRFDIEVGAAYALTDRISAGIGGTFLTGAEVTTHVYLPDPTDQSRIVMTSDVATGNRWGLLAGVHAQLPGQLALGLSWRGETYFQIQGQNELQLKGTDVTEQDLPTQSLDWTPKYSPSVIAAGLAWTTGDVELALDARYTLWSSYRDTQSQRPDFQDTLSMRVGAEVRSSPTARLRLGAGWEPSPVPDQTGRTNYVDNSRAVLSAGSAHEFQVGATTFEASWFAQFHFLMPRTTHKARLDTYPGCEDAQTAAICDEVPDDFQDPQTGQPYPEAGGLQTQNPGFPGFTSGGWLGAVGMEVTF